MEHDDDLGHRRMHPRRSQSPAERDYESKGGGLSSRNRSPGYRYRDPARDHDRGDRPRRERSETDHRGGQSQGGRGEDRNGREDRSSRPRDQGWGSRAVAKPGDAEYGSKERELERQRERERYELDVKGEEAAVEVKPNFGSSGLLAKETNTVKGVELKYNEPPEARKPLKNWRLYVFKGEEQLDLIHIYKQSAYLIGRDQVVTDIPIAHPSCSKQHAVIQFRQITEKNEYGEATTSVKPFIIDLESTNGTHVNDQEIPKTRYYELRNSDVIKFGTSSREYVLLHEDAT